MKFWPLYLLNILCQKFLFVLWLNTLWLSSLTHSFSVDFQIKNILVICQHQITKFVPFYELKNRPLQVILPKMRCQCLRSASISECILFNSYSKCIKISYNKNGIHFLLFSHQISSSFSPGSGKQFLLLSFQTHLSLWLWINTRMSGIKGGQKNRKDILYDNFCYGQCLQWAKLSLGQPWQKRLARTINEKKTFV